MSRSVGELQAALDAALAREAALRHAVADGQRAVAEGLDREAATANILAAISRTPIELEPVLRMIGDAARRLTDADVAYLWFIDASGEVFAWDHVQGFRWAHRNAEERANMLKVSRLQVFCGGIDDWPADDPFGLEAARVEGLGEWAQVNVPLLDTDLQGGGLIVRRNRAVAFRPQDVPLLQHFAAQAVIAIRNSRLVANLEARNAEVAEALRLEEASSAILRQISTAPEQLDETLHAIADASTRMTGFSSCAGLVTDGQAILRAMVVLEGEDILPTFLGGPDPANQRAVERWLRRQDYRVSIAAADDPHVLSFGGRTAAVAPVVGGGALLGYIGIASSTGAEVTPAVVSLLHSFAAQAAIAIENARLIRELRESNRAIQESLDVQRVMGEVLEIVASAPTNLEATLPKIASAAAPLCTEAGAAGVVWIDGSTTVSCASNLDRLVVQPYDAEGPAGTTGQRATREGRVIEWRGKIE